MVTKSSKNSEKKEQVNIKKSNTKNFGFDMENVKKIIKEKKKVLIIGFAILLIVVLLILLVPRFTNDNKHNNINTVSANLNDGIIKEVVVKDLKVDNIYLIRNKVTKQYVFTADVTNIKSDVSTLKQVDIILKDKDGSVLITLLGDISGDGLKPGETKTITAAVSDSINLSKATSKEIKEHVNKK